MVNDSPSLKPTLITALIVCGIAWLFGGVWFGVPATIVFGVILISRNAANKEAMQPKQTVPEFMTNATYENIHGKPAFVIPPPVVETYNGELLPIRTSIKLLWRADNNRKVERVIDVNCFSPRTDGAFEGYCHFRQDWRTITYDNEHIVQAFNADTGDSIPNVLTYLKHLYDTSPARVLDLLQNLYSDVLDVLFYIGKSDGSLRAAEKAIIISLCKGLLNDERLTDSMIDHLFKYMEIPSEQKFQSLVGDISRSRSIELQSKVLHAAEAIVATQKEVKPEEQQALDYLREHLIAVAV